MYQDVLYGISGLRNFSEEIPESLRDSVHYLEGWSHYQLKAADSAAACFGRVGRTSLLGDKSFYYGIFNRIYGRHYAAADSLLAADTVTRYEGLKNLDRAGIALLQKDLSAFETYADKFRKDDYTIASEQSDLLRIADTLRRYPHKSGFLAGAMSAVIPGSGKVYAGKTGQGIAAFLEIAALGLAAGEYYYKSGPESAGFIVFGSLFTFFYIGNIWGSTLAVRVNKADFYERIDNNIMVDLHLPLRRIFN